MERLLRGLSRVATALPPPSQTKIAQGIWTDQRYSQFAWLNFSLNLRKVFCKICKEKDERSVYAKKGSKNLKVSAFHDHGCYNEHKRFSCALHSDGRMMKKAIKQGQRACNESLASLFFAACFIGKQFLLY